jgi:hypothetical protein
VFTQFEKGAALWDFESGTAVGPIVLADDDEKSTCPENIG